MGKKVKIENQGDKISFSEVGRKGTTKAKYSIPNMMYSSRYCREYQ